MTRARKPRGKLSGASSTAVSKRRCGLCGKATRLTRTECCGQWICDDEDKYVMFSYARNSCHRNHGRYTLCAHHAAERHSGQWKECARCPKDFATEIYVYFGTNEYNFDKLGNPPAYDPTRCSKCGVVIVLSEGGYSMLGDKYYCEECTAARLGDAIGPARRRGREGKVRGPHPRPRGGVRARLPRGQPPGR